MRRARTKSRASGGRGRTSASRELAGTASQGLTAAEPVVPEAAAVTETPRGDAELLLAVLDRFRSRFPGEWDRLRLCPLQHGVETIGELLRAARPRG